MLTVLGGLAEFERSLILARTSEGRTRAGQKGADLVEIAHRLGAFAWMPVAGGETDDRARS